jgi:type II secretory pathway component PulF
MSDFLIAHGVVTIVLLVVLVVAAAVAVSRIERINRAWHAFQMRAPLLGELLGQFTAFKLAKALSIMLSGGTPLAQAVEIAQPLLTNPLQRDGLESCLMGLRKGEPIPQAIDRIPGLPVQFHRYVKLGNETGNLGPNLARVADTLQHDFRNRLKSLIAILDPLIIIVMGGGVGFMVISILLAVFNLADVR